MTTHHSLRHGDLPDAVVIRKRGGPDDWHVVVDRAAARFWICCYRARHIAGVGSSSMLLSLAGVAPRIARSAQRNVSCRKLKPLACALSGKTRRPASRSASARSPASQCTTMQAFSAAPGDATRASATHSPLIVTPEQQTRAARRSRLSPLGLWAYHEKAVSRLPC
jgi:hypothetical protein